MKPETILHIIPSFHYDVAYQKTFTGYLPQSLEIINAGLDLLEQYPEFTFNIEQVVLVREYWHRFPERHAQIRRFAGEGRLFFAPGMFTMPDSNLPSAENFIRNALIGREWLEKNVGVVPDCCWMADIFGHNPQTPQLAKTCGFESYMFERGKAGDWSTLFSWQGIDGTGIDTQWEIDTYYGINMGLLWEEVRPWGWVRDRIYSEVIEPLRQNSCCPEILISPLGGDFIKPTTNFVDFLRKWNDCDTEVQMVFSTPKRYFDALRQKGISLPARADDLNPLCEGCYSTRMRYKLLNRRLENLAYSLEMLEIAADGVKLAPGFSDRIWEVLTFNAFHDILCGSLVHDAAREAMHSYEMLEIGTARTLFEIQEEFARSRVEAGEQRLLSCFNPLPYQRREIVEVPSPVLGQARFTELILPPASVSFHASESSRTSEQATRCRIEKSADSWKMSNGLLTLTFADNGTIASLIDETSGLEFADPAHGMNNFMLQPDFGDPWKLDSAPINSSLLRTAPFHNPPAPSGSMVDRTSRRQKRAADADCFGWPEMEIIHDDPLQTRVQFEFEKLGIISRITLRHQEKLVRFKTTYVPSEKKTRLRVAFPTAIQNGTIRHSVPAGHIERPEGEYAVQGWMDYRDAQKGLLLLNKGIPGNNVTDNTMMLTLFRAVSMEKSEIVSWYEAGIPHEFEYAVMPFSTNNSAYNPSRQAECFNKPVHLYPVAGAGVPVNASGPVPVIELLGGNAELTCCKLKDRELTVRFYESAGKPGVIRYRIGRDIESCSITDAAGNLINNLETTDKCLEIPVRPFQITTLRVILR